MAMTTLSIRTQLPKFLKSLPLADLSPRLRDVGLTASNLVIRDGYWVQAGDAPRTIPAFVAAFRT